MIRRSLFLSTLVSMLAIASQAAARAPLKEIKLSLFEIDPKEVGSKARPERRRVIEAAMQLVVSDRSDELMSKGMRVTLDFRDLYQAPDSASSAVKAAMASESLAGVGLPTSYYAEHGSRVTQGSDYVVVSPYATATSLQRFFPNLVLVTPSNRFSASALSDFVSDDLKPKSIAAIVPWDNAFSKNFFEELPAHFRSRVELIKVLDDQQELDGVASKIMIAKPQVVLLPTFPAFTGKIIRTLHDKGYRGEYVGPSSWGEGEGKPLYALTKDLPIKAYLVRETSEYFVTSEQQIFIERFNRVSGMAYSAEAGLYYDAANLIIDRVLEAGKSVDRPMLKNLMARRPQRCGIFSNICSSKDEHPTSIPFYVVTYHNGKFSKHKVIRIADK